MMFGTAGFQKNINVIVGGNVGGYNRAMTGALATTNKFKAGIAAVGVAIVALSAVILTKAVKAAANFELGMAKVKAISSATAKEFEELTGKAKELGLKTAQTMTDIAEGMEAFARAGFRPTQIIGAMGGAVALAESQVMGLGSAVEITAAVLNQMRLPVTETDRVVNALAATASSSATTIESVAESMKYLGPAAARLNVPLEEALAVIGKLGDAGIKGGFATRAFSTALSGLASPTDEAAAMMEKLGLEFFDTHGEFIGIIETVGILEKAFIGMTVEQKEAALGTMFTGAAVRTLSTLLGSGADDLRRYQEELTGTTVAYDQQAAMLDTLKGQWQILTGSIEYALVVIGNKVIPVLNDFVQRTLTPAVNKFSEWADESDALTKALEGFFETVTGGFTWLIDNYGKVVIGLEAILAAFGFLIAQKVVLGVKALTASLVSLFAVLSANPLFWPLLGIGAAAYAAPRIPDYWNLIHDALQSVDDTLVEVLFGPESATKVTQKMVDFLTTSIDDANAILLTTTLATDEVKDAMAWRISAARTDAIALLEEGIGVDFVLDKYKSDVESMLRDFDLLGTGLHDTFVSMLADTIDTWAAMTGVIRTEIEAWGNIVDSFSEPAALLGGFTNPFAPSIPSGSQPGQLGPTVASAIGGDPCAGGVCNVDDMLGDILGDDLDEIIVAPWREALDELRDVMADTPTQATAALKQFLADFGDTPAALLAGSSAAQSLINDLVELQRLGAEGLGGDITYLEEFVGIAAERAAAAADKAAREASDAADKAAREASAAANQAVRDAEEAMRDAATGMSDAFDEKFTQPISQALASGDWMAAANAIREMAVAFPELSTEAAKVDAALKGVEMGSLSQIDVLGSLVGMEGALVGALKDRMQLAKLAGDFDLAGSLKDMLKQVENFFEGEAQTTWQEKASAWMDKGWSSVINAALGMLPGKLGTLAIGLVDVFKKALTDPLGAITSALGVAQLVIQMFFEGIISRLQDQLADLKEQQAALKEQQAALVETMSFYVATLRKVGSLLDRVFGKFGVTGQIASATMNAFISSIEMLTLEGFDLLRAGVEMLTNFVGSLIGAIMGLIEKSDAYQAVQSEGARAWKAISDLFGQFLWPLAALLKHILDWLGIQTQVNEQARQVAEIGVPSIWKRSARAFESASPGQIFTGGETGGGIEIPEWAAAIVTGIAEAIEGMLKSFGIDSWASLLERFKDGSIAFWGYVQDNVPQLISALTSIYTTLKDALGGDVVGSIVTWLKKGFDWLINDAPGVVAKAVGFMGDLLGLAGFVWDWLKDIDWDELILKIEDKFEEFKEVLSGLDSIPEIITEMDKVKDAIDGVAEEIRGVQNEIESMKKSMAMVMAVVGGGIVGAIIGGSGLLGNPATALFGAIAGMIGGGIFAGFFDKGGVVPGPIGQPSMSLTHGQEIILNQKQQAGVLAGLGAGGGGTTVQVFIGDREFDDYTMRTIQHNSKRLTGKRSTSAGIRAIR